MRKVIIELRCNEYAMRDTNPNVPWSPEQIARDAAESREAGAAILHYHARDPETGAPSNDVAVYADTIRRVRAGTDLLINPTLGASTIDDPAERVSHIPKLGKDPATAPDMAPVDLATINIDPYIPGKGFVIDDFTSQAIRFIEQNQDQPFFVYLPYNTPHSPMQVPDRWWDTFKEKTLEMHNRQPDRENIGHVRAALAMCENIDWNVGRLLDRLDQLELAEDTIVVYFADNGPNGFRWNGDMRGRKGSTDEGGVRSPLSIRWPGHIKAESEITQISGAIDLLPTLADLAGIPVASTQPLDGVSLKPLLSGSGAGWPERMIFSHWKGRVSVRTQQYRLDHQGRLYDIPEDPGQRRDVAAANPQLTARLKAAAADWKEEILPGHDTQDRPFLLGDAVYRYTQIPARDGVTTGNVQRSNRYPNCSFFTNWTSLDDRIEWDVEVRQAGTYRVELYYSCPKADIGSLFELRHGKSVLAGRITKPHDPPLEGAEHDRVKRTESYVKDFRALKLGPIKLEAGRSMLTLRALEIPGSQVMDFRLLMFTRMGN